MVNKEKILIFSPYANWEVHSYFEIAVAYNVMWRGHDVVFYGCDGLFSDCDWFWEATTGPRPNHACQWCQNRCQKTFSKFHIFPKWLGKYINEGEWQELKKIIQDVPTAELLHCRFENFPLADWVISSVHSHLRCNLIDLSNSKHEKSLRSYLTSGALAARLVERMLMIEKPSRLLLFNGRMAILRITLELAKKHGIPTFVHERGLLKETIDIWENESCLSLGKYKEIWKEWSNSPLKESEVSFVTNWLEGFSKGKNLNWKNFNQSNTSDAAAFLNKFDSRIIWCLFPSSTDEMAAHRDFFGPYQTQNEWIEQTIDYVSKSQNVALIIRAHPNMGSKSSTGINTDEISFFQDLLKKLPENVLLLMPNSHVNSYGLLDRCDLGLVFASTLSIEMACRGIPVLAAGNTGWANAPIIHRICNKEDYPKLLAEWEYKKLTSSDNLELIKGAYRLAFGYTNRVLVRLPFYKMPDPHNVILDVTSKEDFKPGKYSELDNIADTILGLKPLIPKDTKIYQKQDYLEEENAIVNSLKRLNETPARHIGPKVSVVITCYNYGSYLKKCISSVVAQDFKDYEIIIVNDGSTDDSQDVAEKCKNFFSSVKIQVINQANSGQPAIARNNGILQAKGEFILPLDADDRIAPTLLSECVAVLDAQPEISIAYVDPLYFYEDGRQVVYQSGEFSVKRLRENNCISCCSMYRKDVWEKIGGYRENIRGYEDWDFWLAAACIGFHGKRIPKPLFYYTAKSTGVYAQTVTSDLTKRAQIILNNPSCYTQGDIISAQKIIANEGSIFIKQDNNKEKNEKKLISDVELKTCNPHPNKNNVSIRHKKILIYSDDNGEGGVGNYNYIISNFLVESGAQVTIAQPQGNGPWLDQLTSKGVHFEWMGYDASEDFGRSFLDKNDASRIIVSVNPDLIYFSDCCAFSNMAAKAVAVDKGISYVIICHSEAAYLAERFKNHLPELKRLVDSANQYITVSQNSLDVLRTHFHFPKNKGLAIWNSCADKFFQPPSLGSRHKLRREFGIPDDACLGITTARFDSGKSHAIQIEALRRLKAAKKLGKLNFVWVGEGALKSELQQTVKKLGLEDRIHFIGYRWDIPDILDMADFFVLTSLYEGMPLSIIEAMARGVPVISTKVGGIPEQLEDTGLLIGDPNLDIQKTINELQLALARIVGDPDYRISLGKRAQHRAETFFRKDRMTEVTLRILADALDDKSLLVVPQDPDSVSEFFGPDEVESIKSLVDSFRQNPLEAEVTNALRNLRMGLASHLLDAELKSLPAFLAIDYGEVFKLVSESGLSDLERLPEEHNVAEAARTYFQNLGDSLADARFLLLAMLFFKKNELLKWPSPDLVPDWVRLRYRSFVHGKTSEPVNSKIQSTERANVFPKNESNSTRILFLTGSPGQYMAPPEFGAFQINAGPDWENEKDALGRWKSFKTPVGRYAVDPLLRQLPPDDQPDILVCLVDASRRSMPAGLSAFRGPKVLLVADTHHMHSPLQWMMAYAASEPFDRIAFLYDRHHIPFFQAAGFKNLFWLPGFTFPHDDAALEKVSKLGSQNIVGFVGQAGKFHPRRVRLLEALEAGQIPFLQKALSQSESLKFYASAAVGFNASLNGDLNLRFFELLSSGAAVLTDSLGLDSGLELLADAGCRFETYSSAEELVEKAKNLLGNPKQAAEIGKAGRRWFLEHLRREKRSEIFHRVAFDGFEPEMFKIPSKPSFKVSFSGNQLSKALEVYDFVQELHRVQEKTTILREAFEGDLDFFKSLPRIEIEEVGAGKQGDLLVTTVAGEEACRLADAKHLWLIDVDNNEPSWLRSQGYSRVLSKAAFFERKFKLLGNGTASMEVALFAFAEGRLSDAEDICREILGKDERCAGAWHLMGKMAALQGDLETAGEFATVACELDTQNAEFVRELAEVFLRKKELEPAEQQVRRALEMAPDSPDGLVLLGRILAEKGDKSASLEAFQDALRLRKDYAEGFSQYATALQKFGRGKDAISQVRKACALEPDLVEFQTNLAILLEQNARYVDALAAYGKAARMNPNVGFVWFRQGKLLNGLKRYAESIPALEKAISLPGQLGDYYYEYGLALHMTKRFQEALVHYEKALSMGYETAALHCNRGVIYKDLRKGGDSIMAFYKAVTMDPSNVSYLNNLGAAALELGLNTEALECFEQAVEKNPKLPTARNNIGNLLKDRARGMDALPQYRKSMELNPDDRDAPSNYLLCHMYIPDIDPKLVFEEHKKWGISTAKKFPPAFKFKRREAEAKIRVGFLSADLCHHPVAHFIEPIFRGYDHECFEFVAYGDQRKSDEFSARFAKQVDLWRETSSYDDRALAKLIHEDRVDILFELAGHTAYNRLGVFALKPAPVQVSYLGYPGTTGLPTIDFRITDVFADPQGTTEHLHTEKLIRVPECAWCFEPDAAAPEVEPLPALKNGFVTFGCFNNMAKLNPALFETWAEILLRVPGSHLRLKARTLTDDGVRKELKSYFTERGIEEDRLDFFGHTKKIADHLNHYHSVDIALDSFPYHGTTTTCEAMWMGCPVVTRAGKTHVSRVGVSLLSAVGLQEFITDTRETYIEKAVALAGQTDRLHELRAGMRERMRQSVLMDEKRFVEGFEKALMEMATLGGLMRS